MTHFQRILVPVATAHIQIASQCQKERMSRPNDNVHDASIFAKTGPVVLGGEESRHFRWCLLLVRTLNGTTESTVIGGPPGIDLTCGRGGLR